MFTGELKVTADEDKHASVDGGWLAIDGGDGVMALLERQRSELGDDVGGTLNLLTFEGKHGSFLVESGKSSTVVVEGGVVVLHKCLCQRVWIHLSFSLSLYATSLSPNYIVLRNLILQYIFFFPFFIYRIFFYLNLCVILD